MLRRSPYSLDIAETDLLYGHDVVDQLLTVDHTIRVLSEDTSVNILTKNFLVKKNC